MSQLSRRQLIHSIGLGAAGFVLGPSLSALARQPAASASSDPSLQGAGFFSFPLGEATVSIVSDGGFVMKPTEVFGDVPKGDLEAAAKETHVSLDGFPGQVNCVLVRRGNDVVLIDTGAGRAFGPTAGYLLTNLSRAGVRPADVTHVVLSHAHPDHAGGLLSDDGKPVFTRAKVIVNKDEHDFWMGENPKLSNSKAPEELQQMMVTSAKKNLGGVKSQLELAKPGDRVAGVVTLVEAYGHTPGHVALRVGTTDGPKLDFLGDALFILPLNLRHPEWHALFDADAIQAADTRRKLFEAAAKSGNLTSAAHAPFPAAGYIDVDAAAFKWTPRPWTWGTK